MPPPNVHDAVTWGRRENHVRQQIDQLYTATEQCKPQPESHVDTLRVFRWPDATKSDTLGFDKHFEVMIRALRSAPTDHHTFAVEAGEEEETL